MLGRVAIIGAGISGLTTGCAFRQKGVTVDIFERSESINEFGAGITLSRNATTLLDELGLLDSISAKGFSPMGSCIRNYKSAKVISSISLDDNFITIDRRDLVQQLADSFQELGGKIFLNNKIESIDSSKGILNPSANNEMEYDLILICDGINSSLRNRFFDQQLPKFTGFVAWRGMTNVDKLPQYEGNLKANVYYGPGAHFVHYPTGSDNKVNFIAIERSKIWSEESWKIEGDKSDLIKSLEGWNEELVSMVESTEKLYKWGIFERPLPRRLFSGRCVLLGDAAHPMVPFLGQGGCMAIEDAFCLSYLITKIDDTNEGLVMYDKLRNSRSKWIQRRSKLQGAFNHISNPFLVPIRNLIVKISMRRSVERIHSYDLISELPLKLDHS